MLTRSPVRSSAALEHGGGCSRRAKPGGGVGGSHRRLGRGGSSHGHGTRGRRDAGCGHQAELVHRGRAVMGFSPPHRSDPDPPHPRQPGYRETKENK